MAEPVDSGDKGPPTLNGQPPDAVQTFFGNDPGRAKSIQTKAKVIYALSIGVAAVGAFGLGALGGKALCRAFK